MATATASPGTLTSDSGVGSVAWTNPSNASSSDDSRATATIFTSQTHYLKTTNYGLSVPVGATIDGIVVTVEKQQDKSVGMGNGRVDDAAVRIVKGGTIGSTDKSKTNDWIDASDTDSVYGDSSDKWGETWTVSDINSSGFGFAISCVEDNFDNCDALIDHIEITVHYTESGGSTSQLSMTGVGS